MAPSLGVLDVFDRGRWSMAGIPTLPTQIMHVDNTMGPPAYLVPAKVLGTHFQGPPPSVARFGTLFWAAPEVLCSWHWAGGLLSGLSIPSQGSHTANSRQRSELE